MRSLLIVPVGLMVSGCNVVPYSGTISTYAISGTVVDAESGKPIPGATVCAKYSKLDLQYYLRGVTQTDAAGRFLIPAAPEQVQLLNGPNDAQRPWLNVVHPGYGAQMKGIDSTRDQEVTVRLNRMQGGGVDHYINCTRTSAKAPY